MHLHLIVHLMCHVALDCLCVSICIVSCRSCRRSMVMGINFYVSLQIKGACRGACHVKGIPEINKWRGQGYVCSSYRIFFSGSKKSEAHQHIDKWSKQVQNTKGIFFRLQKISGGNCVGFAGIPVGFFSACQNIHWDIAVQASAYLASGQSIWPLSRTGFCIYLK